MEEALGTPADKPGAFGFKITGSALIVCHSSSYCLACITTFPSADIGNGICPPPIAAVPPPVAAPSAPAVAPPVGPLLGATVPPPIVVPPPPEIVAAVAPPLIIFTPPALAFFIGPPVLTFATIGPGWWDSGYVIGGFAGVAIKKAMSVYATRRQAPASRFW